MPEAKKGWLSLNWIAEMPGNEPPARKYFCTKREASGIVKYWENTVFCLLRSEWVPEVLEQGKVSLAEILGGI